MKATTQIDKLAIQVQQTLFEYFYYHNKLHLEGTFSTPKCCVPQTRSIDQNGKLLSLINQQSSSPKSTAKNCLVRKIHKNKERLGDGEARVLFSS